MRRERNLALLDRLPEIVHHQQAYPDANDQDGPEEQVLVLRKERERCDEVAQGDEPRDPEDTTNNIIIVKNLTKNTTITPKEFGYPCLSKTQ